MHYSLKIIRDTLYFALNNFSDTLTLKVYKITKTCQEETLELHPVKIQQFDEKYILPIPEEGSYKIYVTVKTGSGDNETVIYFNNYIDKLINLIGLVEKSLCGCNCMSCEDCEEDENLLNNTLAKLVSFVGLFEPVYDLLNDLNNSIKTDILSELNCISLNEDLRGVTNTNRLVKMLIAKYYAILYNSKFIAVETKKEYDNILKYDKIVSCIKKLGLDINCIKTIMQNEYR